MKLKLLIAVLILIDIQALTQVIQTPSESKVIEPKHQDNSLVWKMYKVGDSDTSFIVGTIHLPLKKAFSAVDTVSGLLKVVDIAYFELEYDPLVFASQGLFFLARHDSEKVSAVLNIEQYRLFKEKSKELLGELGSVVEMLKPIGALAMFAQSLIPSDTTNAMDVLFQQDAKKIGVKVGGLETMEEQLEVLKKMTITEQKDELVDLLMNFETHRLQFDTLVNAYLNQDLATLKKLTNESFSEETQEFKDVLLTKRNLKMVDKIVKYSTANRCLFAVGAAHLVGDDGLLDLLISKGYQLEPIFSAK
jgi:uncharacterized protein YbaP (TraB family)